jgi:hypothetical protein
MLRYTIISSPVIAEKECVYYAVRSESLRLIHTYHAVPLPRSDSAAPFVKLRVVVGRTRTWPDGPQAVGKTADVNSQIPCRASAVALRSRFQSDMVTARQGHGMVCVN